jgi:hypothetical protein
MDTFHRDNFTGTWSRLFGRVKKHIIVGVVKSVMGIQASFQITFFWVFLSFSCFTKVIFYMRIKVLTKATTSHANHIFINTGEEI